MMSNPILPSEPAKARIPKGASESKLLKNTVALERADLDQKPMYHKRAKILKNPVMRERAVVQKKSEPI